jgi:hypothetical protein
MMGAMKSKRSDYVAAPQMSAEEQRRYQVVMQVLAGDVSVTAGAALLGLSRNRFQTLMHRGQRALAAALMPKAAGRPATPDREAQLAQEVTRLRRENQQLRAQAEMSQRLFQLAGEVLRGRRGVMRTPRATKAKADGTDEGDDEPDGVLPTGEDMRRAGLSMHLAAWALGTSASTLRRWRLRSRRGQPRRLRSGPGPKQPPAEALVAKVAAKVRLLRGLVGAESLRRSVPGVSRRQAATIKRATLRELERERISACSHVAVAAPGIIRGFDAMHLGTEYALVSTDGCVPYRTSIAVSEHYDGAAVAQAVERDFADNGAPLVWRADRAKCHDVGEVHEVLDRAVVLLLHGPPHHPGYYGQLERQQREHRAWLAAGDEDDPDAIEAMRQALNAAWRRRTLGWCTAEEIWRARPRLDVDRHELRLEVQERAARLADLLDEAVQPNLAYRLAVEQTLTARGWLRVETGGLR